MISSDLAATLIGALAATLIAYLEFIRRKLAENTQDTRAAKDAAGQAAATSNGRLTKQINLNQNLQQENYELSLLVKALENDPAGQRALADARQRLGAVRVTRPIHE